MPYHLGEDGGAGPTVDEAPSDDGHAAPGGGRRGGAVGRVGNGAVGQVDGVTSVTAIAGVRCCQRVRVRGRVRSLRVQPYSGTSNLECTLVDDTGGISVLFLGRRAIAGVEIGTEMTAEGMVVDHHDRLAILNPIYELH